jgi:hypothetical protein
VRLIKRGVLFGFFLLCVFSFSGCNKSELLQKVKDSFHLVKEEVMERVKVKLSTVPFIKKYIHLPPPPEALYNSTQSLILNLRDLKAEEVYPDKFKDVLDAWDEADRLYRYKYYFKARRKLKEVMKKAEDLKKELEAYWATLKEKAWDKYKKVEKEANRVLKKKDVSPELRLKIELYLWKLRTLIALERFDRFERELKNKPF